MFVVLGNDSLGGNRSGILLGLYGKTGSKTGNMGGLRLGRRRLLLHMGALFMAVNAGLGALAQPARAQTPQAVTPVKDGPIKIVAFGDSLTAGYLLAPQEAFPVVLGKALAKRGYNVQMINAGVSGDTTAGGRERLAWAVPPDADAVILELGANDALRGLDPAAAKANLQAIIETIRAQKTDILVAGMIAPRSMGENYTKPFDAIFPALAAKYGLPLYPFFLEATGLRPELSLADGLHPNAKGVDAIVAAILPKVEELIGRVKARRAGVGRG